MSCRCRALALVLALVLRAGVGSAEMAPAAVFLRNEEVCVLDERAPMRCLTGDGTAKAALKWAPDGHRIAYAQLSALHEMLALVVVLDDQGSVQQRLPVGAIEPGNAINSTMNAVIGLRWFGAQRLVVEGHLNPSASEYVIFDVESGRTVAEIGDQAQGAGFSADGMHWAVVSGVPHFSRAAATIPTLEIDGRKVLTLKGSEESFASRPRWSDDARQVAILIRRGEDGPVTRVALGRAETGSAQVYPLPFRDARVELHWCADAPCVSRRVPDLAAPVARPGIRALSAQWWRLQRGTWTLLPDPPRAAARPPLDARRAALLEQVRKLGGTDVDLR